MFRLPYVGICLKRSVFVRKEIDLARVVFSNNVVLHKGCASILNVVKDGGLVVQIM